jgi:hypothetical protein
VEIDFMGNGTGHHYEQVKAPAIGYAEHTCTDAFSAHWIRLTPQSECRTRAAFFFV